MITLSRCMEAEPDEQLAKDAGDANCKAHDWAEHELKKQRAAKASPKAPDADAAKHGASDLRN